MVVSTRAPAKGATGAFAVNLALEWEFQLALPRRERRGVELKL